jgi:hypothetical protein
MLARASAVAVDAMAGAGDHSDFVLQNSTVLPFPRLSAGFRRCARPGAFQFVPGRQPHPARPRAGRIVGRNIAKLSPPPAFQLLHGLACKTRGQLSHREDSRAPVPPGSPMLIRRGRARPTPNQRRRSVAAVLRVLNDLIFVELATRSLRQIGGEYVRGDPFSVHR